MKQSILDESWRVWTENNLQRNCDPEAILGILLKQEFALAAIRQAMGGLFPEHSRHLSSLVPDNAEVPTDLMLKRESLAIIQRNLLALNLGTKTVERRRYLSRAEFLEQYYAANRPVIMCDLMTNWKAAERWAPDYLKAASGNEIVEVMMGREKNPNYKMEYESHSRKVKFADYVDMVMGGKETNDYYLVARSNFFQQPVGKPLLRDIEPFPEYLVTDPPGIGALFWFGPKGTVTPLHHDNINILMAQVRGRKHVKLIPASEIDLVYNHYAVYSQVDCEKPDYTKFPKYREATVMDVELAPGEVLFLPVGWWHHVRALDTSITVTFTSFIFPNSYEWFSPGTRDGASGRDYVAPKNVAAHNSRATPGIDHKALCNVSLTCSKKKAITRLDNPKVQLFKFEHFLTDEECDTLTKVINSGKLRSSTVTIYAEGFRTSYTSDLVEVDHPIVRTIDEKIATSLGVRLPYSEGLQAQKYKVGQEFKAHTDYFEPGSQEYQEHAAARGNRTWTFMVYLNDTVKGGGTKFVKLNEIFYPKKGNALIWNNLYEDGTPNPDTLHWGMPVEEGEKIIITKWFRETGVGPMFYDNTPCL